MFSLKTNKAHGLASIIAFVCRGNIAHTLRRPAVRSEAIRLDSLRYWCAAGLPCPVLRGLASGSFVSQPRDRESAKTRNSDRRPQEKKVLRDFVPSTFRGESPLILQTKAGRNRKIAALCGASYQPGGVPSALAARPPERLSSERRPGQWPLRRLAGPPKAARLRHRQRRASQGSPALGDRKALRPVRPVPRPWRRREACDPDSASAPKQVIENLGLIRGKPFRRVQVFDDLLRLAHSTSAIARSKCAMAMSGSSRTASRKWDTASAGRSRLASVWPHINWA